MVLDAGLRSRGDFWTPALEPKGTAVAVGVARFTRVCLYDRPGTTLGTHKFSRSNRVRMPRTFRAAPPAVAAGRVPGPYVLVGHSTAGALDRLYTATYPRQAWASSRSTATRSSSTGS